MLFRTNKTCYNCRNIVSKAENSLNRIKLIKVDKINGEICYK